MHIKFHPSVHLMFCSIIGKSTLLLIQAIQYMHKYFPTCLISFLWGYLIKDRVHRSKPTNQKIIKQGKTGRSSQTLARMFARISHCQVCECGNYHSRCVKNVLSGKRTFENIFCWVQSFKCLNLNDLCDQQFHLPMLFLVFFKSVYCFA